MSDTNPGQWPQQPFHQPPAPPAHVPDYMVWAILEMLFCCQPLGIVGLVFAVMANSKKNSGDIAGATVDAMNSKKFLKIGAWIGGVIALLYLVFYGVMFVLAILGNTSGTH